MSPGRHSTSISRSWSSRIPPSLLTPEARRLSRLIPDMGHRRHRQPQQIRVKQSALNRIDLIILDDHVVRFAVRVPGSASLKIVL